ncbi:MAG TPA: hypothetical protein VGU24_08420, partial [Microvirga sp.]|nr:hypothetical protein [Microvirga sp.]
VKEHDTKRCRNLQEANAPAAGLNRRWAPASSGSPGNQRLSARSVDEPDLSSSASYVNTENELFSFRFRSRFKHQGFPLKDDRRPLAQP